MLDRVHVYLHGALRQKRILSMVRTPSVRVSVLWFVALCCAGRCVCVVQCCDDFMVLLLAQICISNATVAGHSYKPTVHVYHNAWVESLEAPIRLHTDCPPGDTILCCIV